MRPTIVGRSTRSGRGRRVASIALSASSILVAAGCGATGSTDAARSPDPVGSLPALDAPAGTTTETVASSAGSMRGERYCEVLLLEVVDGQASADVYVSYPLNDCPATNWDALDPAAIAAAEGTTLAVLNGPRYWLMDEVTKEGGGATLPTTTFGGIEMRRQASVQVGSLADAGTPYTTREVDRSTVFTFGAGHIVYELHGPDGSTYVMQSWSQQKDPTLVEADLADLGARLQLPTGWTYGPRVLDQPLVVDTVATPARVLQDELANSYSFVAPA